MEHIELTCSSNSKLFFISICSIRVCSKKYDIIEKPNQLNSLCKNYNRFDLADEIDDALEGEVTEECSNYGQVEKVVVYQEKQWTGILFMENIII